MSFLNRHKKIIFSALIFVTVFSALWPAISYGQGGGAFYNGDNADAYYQQQAAAQTNDNPGWLGQQILTIFAWVGNIVLGLFGVVLVITGYVLDISINLTVVNMKDFFDLPGIQSGWAAARDVCNIFFIFILLYAAISTMLQSAAVNARKILPMVIFVALIINFSGVVTKTVIDSSNVLAYQFYQQINPASSGATAGFSMWQRFTGILRLDKAPGVTPVIDQAKLQGKVSLSDPESKGKSGKALNFFSVIVGTIGGVIIILLSSFLFLVISFLLFFRLIFLIFLYILSPFAFIAWAMPGQGGNFNKWFHHLFNQSFFAPAFLFCIYFVIKIASGQEFGNLASSVSSQGSVWGETLSMLVVYVIVMGLLIGSVFIAKAMSAFGADQALNYSGKINRALSTVPTSVIGGTIGRGATRIAETDWWRRSTERTERLKQRVRESGAYKTLSSSYEQGNKMFNAEEGAGSGLSKASEMFGAQAFKEGGFLGFDSKARADMKKAADEAKDNAEISALAGTLDSVGKIEDINKATDALARIKEIEENKDQDQVAKARAIEDIEKKDPDAAALRKFNKLLNSSKMANVAKLDASKLANPAAATLLNGQHLEALMKSPGMKSGDMQKLLKAVQGNPSPGARKFLKTPAAQNLVGEGEEKKELNKGDIAQAVKEGVKQAMEGVGMGGGTGNVQQKKMGPNELA